MNKFLKDTKKENQTVVMDKFIAPNISKFRSFSELESFEKSLRHFAIKDKSQINLIDIYQLKKAIVMAEPGLGKTRLLQEIVLQAKTHERKAIFVSLKKSVGKLDKYIAENTKNPENVGNIKKDVFTSEVFQLENSDSIIVCLDALDEVQVSNVSTIIDGIKEFNKQYPEVSITVSCRRNYYDQYASVLTDDSFSFLTLSVFSKNQVKEYLRNAGIDAQKIKELTSKLSFKNRDLILQVPRYLCMLPEILTKLPNTNFVRKSDLFKEFTYFKINNENEKKDKKFSQKIDLITRVLEKVALIMEIQQSNLLTKEDLITLFDDIKSNLCVSFLNQVDISVLYERSLLRDNFDGTMQFESTEIQEYLAAVEISRLGHFHQVVFDFAVEPELLEIYPSWYNTLSFLVEIDPMIVFQLAQLARNKVDKLQSEDFHKLITSVPELMPYEHAVEVFNQTFQYYQSNSVLLSLGIAENLAKFPINLSQMVTNQERLNETLITNIIRFAGYRGKHYTSELGHWKELLFKFTENSDEELKKEIIFAFGLLKDMESLSFVAEPLLYKGSKITIQYVVAACIAANPNHSFAIKAFVEGTKQDDIMARYGFYDVTDAMSLKMIFDYLIQDENFRIKFMKDETFFHDEDVSFLAKIEKFWDNDFEEKLIKVITETIKNKPWYVEKSDIIENLVVIAKKKDSNFVFRLIDALISPDVVKETVANWYHLPKLIGQAITKGQVAEIFAKLSIVEKGKNIIFQALQYANSLQFFEIYEEGRIYFQTEYAELENKPKVPDKKESDVEKILNEFRFKLQPEPGKFIEDVFLYFWRNRHSLVPLLSPDDFDRLKELITGSVLDVFDIETITLTIDKEEGNSRTYTTSTVVSFLKDCIKIIAEYNLFLKIDLDNYRNKFVDYIPFASTEDLDTIFCLLPELTPKDIESLLKVYIGKRKDDLGYFAPGNFLTVCKRYKIPAVAGLRKIIEDDHIALYIRQDALETLIELSADKQFLLDLYSKYSLDTQAPTFLLAEIANAGIIKNFGDIDAVEWRVKELIRRKFRFTRIVGAHTVSPQEHELYNKDFARPIIELHDP